MNSINSGANYPLSNKLIAECIANLTVDVKLEETDDDFVFHIPKAVFNKQVVKLDSSTKPVKSLFGFMQEKPFNIPENFDDLYDKEIAKQFSDTD